MLWYHSFQSAREPMNSYTHFLGALLSLIGLPLSVLLYFAKGSGEPLRLLAALIFCCSTLALYTTSCVYHFSHGTPAHLNHLRKLDHSMIYLLIAGQLHPHAHVLLSPAGGIDLQSDPVGHCRCGHCHQGVLVPGPGGCPPPSIC